MSYDFDEGSNSSSDSAIGPFLNWHARETLDGALGSRTFSVRDEEGERVDVTAKMKKGVAFSTRFGQAGASQMDRRVWLQSGSGTTARLGSIPPSRKTGEANAGKKVFPSALDWGKIRPQHGLRLALVRGPDLFT